MSKMSRTGLHRKALEIFYSLPQIGISYDTTITNAAISACDKGAYHPLHTTLSSILHQVAFVIDWCHHSMSNYAAHGPCEGAPRVQTLSFKLQI